MKMVSTQQHRQHSKGFTLIETLVSITILLVMITGGFVAMRTGLQSTFAARDQVTAFFLAQEAVEIVKNVRDTNAVEGDVWDDGLGICKAGNRCYVDATATEKNDRVGTCASDDDCQLYQHEDGLYGHTSGTGWEETRFYREVRITEDLTTNEDELRVDVLIRYGDKELRIREHIFNIRTS